MDHIRPLTHKLEPSRQIDTALLYLFLWELVGWCRLNLSPCLICVLSLEYGNGAVLLDFGSLLSVNANSVGYPEFQFIGSPPRPSLIFFYYNHHP